MRFGKAVGLRGAIVAVVTLAACGLGVWAWSRSAPDPLASGRSAYERGEWAEAERRARSALAANKDDREAVRLLARATARQGKDDVTKRLLQRLGVEAMQAEDHLALGLALLHEGRPKDAREALRVVLEDQKDHAEARYLLAKMALDEARPAEADELASPLLADPRWASRAGVVVGLARDAEADPAGAVAALAGTLEADPKLADSGKPPAEARILLARDFLKLDRGAEARAQLLRVLADGPDPEASWLLSRAALQAGDLAAAKDALRAAGTFATAHPERFEPAPFVGSARCAECHAEISRAQTASRHARTFHRVADWEAKSLPQGEVPDPHDPAVAHRIGRKGELLEVETKTKDARYRAVVEFVLGSGDRGVTFVGRDDAGKPREVRMSHFGLADAWDVTAGHPKAPAATIDYLGLAQSRDALLQCLSCHTTHALAILDGRDSPETRDHAIGCERCHGPGGNHLRAVEDAFPDPAIGHPRLASSAAITGLCGQCHGVGNRQVPKEDPIALLRFQATTLPMSRCYTKSEGHLSCLSCHDPHRNAETSTAYYEAKCLACHGPAAHPEGSAEPLSAPTLPESARRVPCPVDPAKGCIGCHMPERESQMPHSPFTDHDIRVDRAISAALRGAR